MQAMKEINFLPALRSSLVHTLAWFDIFDYPPTAEELYKYLWKTDLNIPYPVFLQILDYFEEHGEIRREHAFYMFPDRSGLAKKRNDAIWLVEEKMNIAKKAIKKIHWIPFVEAVFVCNTVAFGWPKKESDVDVFVVVKKGRLWLTRFLVTTRLSFANLRRNKKQVSDKICLSFYVTDDNLDLSEICMDSEDVYLVYWLNFLIPVYDPKYVRVDLRKHNRWVEQFTVRFLLSKTLKRYAVRHTFASRKLKRFFEIVWSGMYGSLLETQAKKLQKLKMKKNKNSLQDKHDTRVVITDSMLKFHENDRRALFKKMWRERVATHI